MRTIDKPDDMQPLAPPIRAPKPEPRPSVSKDGRIVTGADGRMSTNITPPPTIWDFFRRVP